MIRTLYAGMIAGTMILASGQAFAQTAQDSWSPAGAAAADPGSAPAVIHNASGTDGILSVSSDAGSNNTAGSGTWAPAGAAAAD